MYTYIIKTDYYKIKKQINMLTNMFTIHKLSAYELIQW